MAYDHAKAQKELDALDERDKAILQQLSAASEQKRKGQEMLEAAVETYIPSSPPIHHPAPPPGFKREISDSTAYSSDGEDGM